MFLVHINSSCSVYSYLVTFHENIWECFYNLTSQQTNINLKISNAPFSSHTIMMVFHIPVSYEEIIDVRELLYSK